MTAASFSHTVIQFEARHEPHRFPFLALLLPLPRPHASRKQGWQGSAGSIVVDLCFSDDHHRSIHAIRVRTQKHAWRSCLIESGGSTGQRVACRPAGLSSHTFFARRPGMPFIPLKTLHSAEAGRKGYFACTVPCCKPHGVSTSIYAVE